MQQLPETIKNGFLLDSEENGQTSDWLKVPVSHVTSQYLRSARDVTVRQNSFSLVSLYISDHTVCKCELFNNLLSKIHLKGKITSNVVKEENINKG